ETESKRRNDCDKKRSDPGRPPINVRKRLAGRQQRAGKPRQWSKPRKLLDWSLVGLWGRGIRWRLWWQLIYGLAHFRFSPGGIARFWILDFGFRIVIARQSKI